MKMIYFQGLNPRTLIHAKIDSLKVYHSLYMHGFHVRDAVILFLESFIRKKKTKNKAQKKE